MGRLHSDHFAKQADMEFTAIRIEAENIIKSQGTLTVEVIVIDY